ncbi:hypothetical protein CQ062_13505 [Ochrobactrum sp. MYb68]|nr:hypothetical protein CQ062_13505 [Ochrobactrum sp. MYb68]
MAVPTPEKANLQIRMTNKGKLRAFWKGEELPCIKISVDAYRMQRAEVTLSFVGPQVNLNTEPDDA